MSTALPRRVSVEVPASSANLGPGFDCLALALGLQLAVTLDVLDEGPSRLDVRGEGARQLALDRSNRFVVGWERGLAELGVPEPPGVAVRMRNEIPLARGLGSSAAAAVAGLVAARAVTGGDGLGTDRLLALATEIEGHADNAAAALLGGFVVVAGDRVVRYPPPADLRAVLFVPDRELPTDDMRAALPSFVSHGDAAHNVGRAALVVSAFATGDLSLLAAMDDRLHEPYRTAAFPQLPTLLVAARQAGALGAALSGAGSSVIALCDSRATADGVSRALTQAAGQLGLAGSSRVVAPAAEGARVISGEDTA